ncbi:DNA helicase MCM8, putative [Plasmodium vinckei vinckei]|uniref:DNA helicase n=1 Tax=Plasmodium vinckei vinckei TaxID=54757 RepID=A0A449BQ17_PLAVN|nr:DNA helicase MCM8, putative [Plasmodium vinckei vinckei]VEV55478.1 DNA helicase MCM8, putative [Plasmodium vinckei vinckei]
MDRIVQLYFNNLELNDEVKKLILSWVTFFNQNWEYLFNIDKDVILNLEFFLDNKKIINRNAPPNNEIFLHELQKNPEIVLKFMKVAIHLLLYHVLGLNKVEEENSHAIEQNAIHKKRKNMPNETENESENVNFIRDEEIEQVKNDNILLNDLKYDRYKESEIFRTHFFSTQITIYLYNWNKVNKFKNLKSEKVNQLVCLRGSILRVSPVQLLITKVDFICEKCRSIFKIEFIDGKFEIPKKCLIKNCDSKNFVPLRESAKSIEYQKIILKENKKNTSNIYETDDTTNIKNLLVTLEVTKFFVNTCLPGSYVEALGILKVISHNNNYLINGKNSIFNMYVDCISIFSLSSKKYFNNNTFNIQKIKKEKKKIYSTLLWQSYIDNVDKKVNQINVEKDTLEKLTDKNKTKTSNTLNVPNDRSTNLKNVNEKDMQINQSYGQTNLVDKEYGMEKKNDQLFRTEENNQIDKLFSDIENVIKNNATLDSVNMYGDFMDILFKNNNNLNNSYINKEGKSVNTQNESRHNNLTNPSMDFDNNTLTFIKDFEKYKNNKFYLLVSSFCPRVIMNYYIKAGLLLSLLGGKTIYDQFGEIKRRGNIHLLLIGDPGLGKSRILQYISNIIEKSLFICSTSTSINGLTACAVKDSTNNEYSLEGGALVLSDKGVCCIDELDKVSLKDQQSFLECMESQCINISKAGIVCNLKTRCTIIAASNPKEGKYNYNKTIFDNIKIPLPLLSRFDMVFLLTDKISEEKDMHISNYLITSTNDTTKNSYVYDQNDQNNFENLRHNDGSTIIENNENFDESIFFDYQYNLTNKCKQIDESNYLPIELLGIFVKYCRKTLFPILSNEAKQYIKKFYIHLRNTSIAHSNISVPITIRQLESLIRLCQARARADLSNIVTLEHAKEVVVIYQKTIFYPLSLKMMNFKEKKTSKGPRGKSAKALSGTFKKDIIQLAQISGNKINNKDLRNLAQSIIQSAESNISDDALIHLVNEEGFILYKGNHWQVDAFYLK